MKAARILVGIVISTVFACLTISRVDLGAAGHALGKAAPLGIALAFVFACLEIAARSWRWRYLLSPLGKVSFKQAFAYTCVGYFANTLLPMRLGDVARAYLAAAALKLPRMATLGSIVTDRLADGLTILVLAGVLGLVVSDASSLASTELWIALGIVGFLIVATATVLVARHKQLVRRLIPKRIYDFVAGLVLGASAARTPKGVAVTVGATLVAYACSVGVVLGVAGAVGLSLSPAQAAFATAAIGLSAAIPAAPGSVGTYEFVGVSVLTALGQDPATALATMVLLHVIGTLPAALVGLVMTWVLHLRVWRVELAPTSLQTEAV
jgi:uncharacterized protein (TIRG00374 family)